MTSLESATKQRASAKTGYRRLTLYMATNSISNAMYIVVFGEYVLIEVANSDVIWAAQLAAINNSVIYASRVFVGNPLMGNVSDLLGRRVGLMIGQGSFLVSMALFVYFPSIFTLLGGSCLAGCLTAEPVTQSYLADLTTVFTLTDYIKTAKVQPQKAKEDMTEAELIAYRLLFAKKSSKLIALLLATYTFFLAVGAMAGSIMSAKLDEEADGDAESFNSTNSTIDVEKNNCDAAKETAGSTDHMKSTFDSAIFLSIICFLVTTTLGNTEAEKQLVEQNKSTRFSPIEAWFGSYNFVKSHMLNIKHVRVILFLLFYMKSVEFGAISIFFYYGKFQFDWTASEYAIFIMVIVLANAFANTVMVNLFNRLFKNQWNAALFCMIFLTLEFVFYFLATTASAFTMAALFNSFNFLFSICKAKVFANYDSNEFGKVAGGQEAILNCGSIFGPIIFAALFTFGVDQTGLPDCVLGTGRHHYWAAFPWAFAAIAVFLCGTILPYVKRLDTFLTEGSNSKQ